MVKPGKVVNSMHTTEEEEAVKPVDYEEERGKPMPSLNHAAVQSALIVAFAPSKEFSILSELTLELPDGARLTPDISVYPRLAKDWRHDVVRMKTMPKLAVEIPSPSQGFQEIADKLDLYFAHGVESVWVVQPGMQSVAIYLPNVVRPIVVTEGEAKDPVTGLTARLEDLFA